MGDKLHCITPYFSHEGRLRNDQSMFRFFSISSKDQKLVWWHGRDAICRTFYLNSFSHLLYHTWVEDAQIYDVYTSALILQENLKMEHKKTMQRLELANHIWISVELGVPGYLISYSPLWFIISIIFDREQN